MHEAILITNSKDKESVSEALKVDNKILGELEISTKIKDDKIISKVKANSIKTLLNTLDDLIHCQITAEKIIFEEKYKGW